MPVKTKKFVLDLYLMDEIPMDDFLLEDQNNVIFHIDKEFIGINRVFLKLDKSSIFWSCEEPLEKYARLALRNASFVQFEDINFVLKRDVRQISLVFDHLEPKIQSNDVFEAKVGSGISGMHCQDTSMQKIYKVSKTTMKTAVNAPKIDLKLHKTAVEKYINQKLSRSSSKKSNSTSKSRSNSIGKYEAKYDVAPRSKLVAKSGRLKKVS
jgi:sRNA-binding carbon storage regulator CsrA